MLMIVAMITVQVSKGLWKKFGDKRVMDTPITEVISMLHCIVKVSDTIIVELYMGIEDLV